MPNKLSQLMPGTAINNSNSNKIIFYFLLFWTAINAVQAFTLELQADEAYYWLYSKYLDWGYFDHPPMVAIFIRIGDSLLHTEFGLRIMTVLASSGSIYLLWLILKKYSADAFSFALVVSGIFIFHIYGFTTTPDSPLFFFTVLFYFLYQRYIDEDRWWLALLLALTIACLLYSKYNAVLLIGFTLLANIRLVKRWSFWFIVIAATCLYIPHLLWEARHGWPSINYHLFERSADTYNFINSLSYLPAQLLMAGPLIGWFLFYKAFTIKIKDTFTRCLMVNCVGTLIFFFISSIRGEVQPQWTFVLYAPLVLLALIHFKQQGGRPKWLLPVAITNLSIILIVRIIVISGVSFARTYGHLKSYYGFKEWASVIKQKAGDNYVIMVEGFQNPSKYDYYTNSLKCFAYDTRGYRLTQFDIWPMEDSLQHKKAYFLTSFPINRVSTDSMKLSTGTWYGGWVNDVRTYQKVIFDAPSYKIKASPGQKLTFDLTVTNPYPYAISFSNTGYLHPVVLEACLFKGDVGLSSQKAPANFNDINLKPGASTHYTFTLTSPLEKGNFDLVFSVRTEPFPGSKNSRIIKLTVN